MRFRISYLKQFFKLSAGNIFKIDSYYQKKIQLLAKIMKKPPQLNQDWKELLSSEWNKPYMDKLSLFLQNERERFEVYPRKEDLFSAFNYTSFDQVNVVIVGQDPYHGPNQAHGLSFSVPKGVQLPPSLKNIYKELRDDLGIEPAQHGHLKKWASQGILLLNSILTVRKNSPGSHANQGWEQFTDQCLESIALQKKGVIFVLWGESAKRKCEILKNKKEHLFFFSPHPSPFSAHRGFFGSRPFSRINQELLKQKKQPIDWDLNELF